MKSLIILLITGLLCVACSTTSQARSAKSLLVIGESVAAAMNAYGELYRAGEVPEKSAAKVRLAYAKYQLAYGQAVEAMKMDLSAPAPYELAALASDIVLTIEAIAQ